MDRSGGRKKEFRSCRSSGVAEWGGAEGGSERGAEEGVQELQESDQLPVVSVSRQLKRSKSFIESGFAAKSTSAKSFYRNPPKSSVSSVSSVRCLSPNPVKRPAFTDR